MNSTQLPRTSAHLGQQFKNIMTFNSSAFFIFFSVTFCLYYLLPHRWQNRMLLSANFLFYGWWDWRFLGLILISISTDYFCSLQINHHPEQVSKKKFLALSITINLGILGFFKYFNFFISSFADALKFVGLQPHLPVLQIILPVGISFYTFKTISYSVDVYRGEIEPTKNFTDYALFVSFFPQLIAGPIERAGNLLPQIQNKRRFDKRQLKDGLQLFFWGLFKKVFVADNLGLIVDQVYGNPQASGAEYIVATWAFAFQIYSDFSGYSDMAQGLGKCLGFEMMQNFKQPYFAISPSDFWRRWHISLSTWMRDYLYIPLGGNKKGPSKTYRNLMLTMLLAGLWHGAAWNFVIWGGYHGLLLVGHRMMGAGKKLKKAATSPLIIYLLKAFFMFQFVCIGWIFFRAQSLEHIFQIISRILNYLQPAPEAGIILENTCFLIAFPLVVMAVRTLQEIRPSMFEGGAVLRYLKFSQQPIYLKSFIYGVMAYLVCLHGVAAKSFIYMQF